MTEVVRVHHAHTEKEAARFQSDFSLTSSNSARQLFGG